VDAGILVFFLIFKVVYVVACIAIANSKGRNAALWGFLGFLLGLIGVIIVAVLPNVREEQVRQMRAEEENRRLREQLRQERIKAESFRQHAQTRLDAHDQHLGIDTRQTAGALGTGTGAVAGQLGQAGETQWYYDAGGNMVGPVAAQEVRAKLRNGHLTGATLVWAEHMTAWQPARLVGEFSNDVFRGS